MKKHVIIRKDGKREVVTIETTGSIVGKELRVDEKTKETKELIMKYEYLGRTYGE